MKSILPLLAFALSTAATEESEQLRLSPTVKLIREVKAATVPVFAEADGNFSSGAGAIIHPHGFILTADHVTRDGRGVAIFGLQREEFRIIGRLPEKDIAILKVQSPEHRDYIPMGRSQNVWEGESILAVGNPGGRGIVYSLGIVSSASVDPTWPHILAKTYWRDQINNSTGQTDGRDDYIQFDAASNRGNSGGPLLNAAGELIGIVARKSNGEEAINWAIPIDRVRRLFDYIVQPEEAHGFWAGAQLDMLAPNALINSVTPDSPASAAGLAPGDIILTLAEHPVSTSPDWLLLLTDRKSGDELPLEYERAGERRKTVLRLADYPLPAPVEKKGLKPGLNYELFRGAPSNRLRKIPDFSTLQPEQSGSVKTLSPDSFVNEPKENYAVRFKGYIEFPAAGQYRLILGSDDGSKCYINNQLIIDHDYAHPAHELSRTVRVPKGLVPVRLEYFESRGGRALTLQIKSLGSPGTPISDAQFYREPK